MTKNSLYTLVLMAICFSYANASIKTEVKDKLSLVSNVTFVEDTVCPGESALLIVDAGPNATVQWLDEGKVIHMGDSLRTDPLKETKTYKVSYKTRRKAEPKIKFLVATVRAADSYQIVSSPEEIDNPKQAVEFSIDGQDSIQSFKWDFGDRGLDTLSNPKRTFMKAGSYELGVEITTRFGCTYKLLKSLEVKQPPHLDFPSAFSPNGDGFNDSLKIGHYDLQSFILKIFDRKGNLIFETENPDFVWDGMDIFGERTPEGVYSCKVSAVTNDKLSISKKLTLALIR